MASMCKLRTLSRVGCIRLFSTSIKMNEPINIMCLNTFLIPSLFAKKGSDGNVCRDQKERAARIAQRIKDSQNKLQVIALQEVWGTEVDVLEKAVVSTHKVFPGMHSISLFGIFANLINSVRFWMNRTGGLWLAHSTNLKLLHHQRYTFTISSTKSKKGVQAALLDMDPLWPSKYLLIFNTHLDAVDRNGSKKIQVEQLQSFMAETLQSLSSKIPLKNCGVLLMGDFNISSISSGYSDLISNLGMRDLYKEFIDERKLSEEATMQSSNSYTSFSSPLSWRIDYIFSFNSMQSLNQELLPLRCKNFVIEKQVPKQEYSDHWPLFASVVPKE